MDKDFSGDGEDGGAGLQLSLLGFLHVPSADSLRFSFECNLLQLALSKFLAHSHLNVS